jgi:DNA-binding response OmpR family regulator
VDDEPNIVVPLKFLMEQNGHDVAVASNGDEALDLVSKFKPDLILLDIMLPVRDGFEICQIVRGDPQARKTKIILLSALVREADISKGMAFGADAYITKPFANSEILARIEELLNDVQ